MEYRRWRIEFPGRADLPVRQARALGACELFAECARPQFSTRLVFHPLPSILHPRFTFCPPFPQNL